MFIIFQKTWDRLWFKPLDAHSAGAFRIATGLLCFTMYLCLAPNWIRFFAADGILSLSTGGRARTDDVWSLFHLADGYVNTYVLLGVGIVASISFTIGFKTRTSTILLFLLQASMIHRTRAVVNGEDLVLRMLLFYSCFAPLGSELSVDAWLSRKKGVEPKSSMIWPIRLMQINFALIYAFSLPIKLQSDVAWLNGDLMYYVLINETWSRWLWPEVLYNGVLSKIMTYAALMTEGLFPVLVWFKRARIPCVLVAMFFHVCIAIVLNNVTFFSLSMFCGLVIFLPGDLFRNPKL